MRRTREWSTAQRLIVMLTASVTVVLLVTALVSIVVIHSLIDDRINSRLVDTSQRIKASLVGLPGLTIDRATIDNMAKAGLAVVVMVEDGQPVGWMNGDADTARLAVESAVTDGEPHEVHDRADLTAIWLDTTDSGLTVVDGSQRVSPTAVVVAISTSREAAALRTITGVSVAGMVAAIATLVALTAFIVGRGLRPLRVISERAEEYANGNRSVRLPENLNDVEMARLASTLNHALDAQQEAEQRLRSFVADASHELRTPLTIATGWIELDGQGGLSDQDRRDHAMERVQVQLGRMRILIDELALLARLDRERPLTLEDVDLTSLTNEVVDDARLMNPDRSFTVTSTGPAALRADGPRLQQVLANLVGNAVKHTPAETPVEVTVTPAPETASPGTAMHTVLVTDHGPGIPAREQRYIFERFWRGDSSRHRQTGGSGLGLAIVASIVAAHGGTSEVISTPGEGTTIRIRLPLSPEAHPPSRGRAQEPALDRQALVAGA
jgi:two-component system OmpR family sensor kinase